MISKRQHVDPTPVDSLAFGRILGDRPKRTEPVPKHRVMLWYDDRRRIARVCRWQGPCIGCGVQTFSFDDGDNDPRGVLGDSAYWGVDLPHDRDPDNNVGLYARACPGCANDYVTYKYIQREAGQIGYAKVAPYEYGKTWDELRE